VDQKGKPREDWDVFDHRRGIKRMPRVPDRSELYDDEKEDWDLFQQRYQRVIDDKRDHPYRHRIAGGFFGLMCSPGLAQALVHSGKKVTNQQGKPGSFTASDHEFIDLVLSFDSGHWGLLANHSPWAVASGIPVETIEVLRDGKEDSLDEADRQIIAFIRAARDGTITDEMWEGMKRRLGTERGVVEMLFLTLHLLTHVRLAQAFDEPQITPDEFADLLQLLREGRVRLPTPEHHGPPVPG
jgi:hypothetical protein